MPNQPNHLKIELTDADARDKSAWGVWWECECGRRGVEVLSREEMDGLGADEASDGGVRSMGASFSCGCTVSSLSGSGGASRESRICMAPYSVTNAAQYN